MINIATLSSVLEVDETSGRIFWLKRPCEMFDDSRSCNSWNARFAGAEAFTAKNSKGYHHGKIFGENYCRHVIVWAISNNRWPEDGMDIDHDNGVNDDDRLINLYEVTPTENARNRKVPSNNTSGAMGVRILPSGNWSAYIAHDGKQVWLGTFDKKDQAIDARISANKKYGYHANHGHI